MGRSIMESLAVFVVVLTIVACDRHEPRCSRFDYDEKLLEKTIRLEMKLLEVEKNYMKMRDEISEERIRIQKEREAMNEQMQKSIENGSKKMTAIETRVEELGDRLLKDVNDATSELGQTQRQYEETIIQLAADVQTFQNETMSKLTNLLMTSEVHFRAQNSGNQVSLASKQLFVFENVLEEEGEGYNNGDGVFTVPLDGYYIFATQLCNRPKKYVYFSITINDVRKTETSLSTVGYTCTTSTVIARVKKGARVAVMSTSSSYAYCDGDGDGCYFSAYLLKPTTE